MPLLIDKLHRVASVALAGGSAAGVIWLGWATLSFTAHAKAKYGKDAPSLEEGERRMAAAAAAQK